MREQSSPAKEKAAHPYILIYGRGYRHPQTPKPQLHPSEIYFRGFGSVFRVTGSARTPSLGVPEVSTPVYTSRDSALTLSIGFGWGVHPLLNGVPERVKVLKMGMRELGDPPEMSIL